MFNFQLLPSTYKLFSFDHKKNLGFFSIIIGPVMSFPSEHIDVNTYTAPYAVALI
jgi:hypothetical protein